MPHRADELEARLADVGWRVKVVPTAGPFYWAQAARPDVGGHAAPTVVGQIT